MAWLGKAVGGAFGFMLGGPLGAFVGASLGHQFDIGMIGLETPDTLNPGNQQRVQMEFFTATFSVMGYMAKSDGRVSPEEISLANRIMDQMFITGDMRGKAIHLFQEGKRPDFPLDERLAQFYKECRRRVDLTRMFVEIQIQVALADGAMDSREEELLSYICDQLRISRFEYERLKMRVMAQQRFNQYSHHHQQRGGHEHQGHGRQESRYERQYQQQSHQQSKRPSKSTLQDAYEVLGLSPSASDDEVKKAYRRLMSQNHPDKLAAKGLPEEMMRLAKEKTQQISKAYDTIQQARKH